MPDGGQDDDTGTKDGIAGARSDDDGRAAGLEMKSRERDEARPDEDGRVLLERQRPDDDGRTWLDGEPLERAEARPDDDGRVREQQRPDDDGRT